MRAGRALLQVLEKGLDLLGLRVIPPQPPDLQQRPCSWLKTWPSDGGEGVQGFDLAGAFPGLVKGLEETPNWSLFGRPESSLIGQGLVVISPTQPTG